MKLRLQAAKRAMCKRYGGSGWYFLLKRQKVFSLKIQFWEAGPPAKKRAEAAGAGGQGGPVRVPACDCSPCARVPARHCCRRHLRRTGPVPQAPSCLLFGSISHACRTAGQRRAGHKLPPKSTGRRRAFCGAAGHTIYRRTGPMWPYPGGNGPHGSV